MIIKQTNDDFFVEEVSEVQPGANGAFAVYRLEKRGWTTPDALQVVKRRWKLESRRVSYGGLKDRHAHTFQYVSIFHGPSRNLHQQDITLTYLGQLTEPFRSEQIRANRFRMVLRGLSDADRAFAATQLPDVARFGVPNYFDDQRFGSVDDGAFIAKHFVLGEFEAGLKMALTAPYAHDRRPQKREKATLVKHWGDWATCKEMLARGNTRSLIDYLVSHPQDFRGVILRMRPEMRGLYLSAFQSHLWNRMLAEWIRDRVAAEQRIDVPLRLGAVPMQTTLTDEQQHLFASTQLPLHSPRVVWNDNDERRPYFERALAAENLTLEQLKLKGLKEIFFSRGERAVQSLPAALRWESDVDELRVGKSKITLEFELQRGAYATLIVKRLTPNQAQG